MDLTTGPGLVSAIADYLNRQDLSAVIPSWIRMAEAQVNRALRVREQIKRSTSITSDDYIDLPTDFLELRSIQLVTPANTRHALTMAANDDLLAVDVAAEQSQNAAAYHVGFVPNIGPRFFSIIGKTLRLAPAPTDQVTLEMVYYSTIPTLDVTTPGATTWLLQAAPDVYLFSSLVFAAPFLQEDQRTEMWSQMASGAVQQMNDLASRALTSGSRMNKKITGF